MLHGDLMQKGNNAQFVICCSVFVIIFHCFCPVSSHHQVLYLKRLEEECYCTINMSKLK